MCDKCGVTRIEQCRSLTLFVCDASSIALLRPIASSMLMESRWYWRTVHRQRSILWNFGPVQTYFTVLYPPHNFSYICALTEINISAQQLVLSLSSARWVNEWPKWQTTIELPFWLRLRSSRIFYLKRVRCRRRKRPPGVVYQLISRSVAIVSTT